MMEDKQMQKYWFFRRIGAFSINRNDPRKAIYSLRYVVQSFQRENASLFIYPEGTLTPAGSPMNFEGGLAWLYRKLPDVDFVPIGIHIHTIRYDKPELHLQVGNPVTPEESLSNEEQTHFFEKSLDNLLIELRQSAGFNDSEFEQFL